MLDFCYHIHKIHGNIWGFCFVTKITQKAHFPIQAIITFFLRHPFERPLFLPISGTNDVATPILIAKLLLPPDNSGPVAQRIRHLTTNQGIAGSNPARVKKKLFLTNETRNSSHFCESSFNKLHPNILYTQTICRKPL